MAAATRPQTPAFGAFISYSREDEAFAVELERALEDYAPPTDLAVPQRNLNIFRDKEDITGTEYNQSIERFLSESAKLIILCSPHARSSSYVNDEIRRFAKARGPEHIVPVLIAGIPNNEATPAREAERAFPDALCEVMAIPLAAEYRGFDKTRDRIDKGRFEGSWYTVLANIYNVSRSELEQRDKKRQARLRRIRMGIAAAVGIALVGLTLWALVSRQEAISRQLAASALSQLAIDPERSILLAAEGLQAKQTPEAEEALRYALTRSHVRRVLSGHSDWVNDVSFSPTGKLLATASNDKTVRLWKVASSEPPQVLRHAGPVRTVSFSPKGDSDLLTVSGDSTVQVWHPATGSKTVELKGHTGYVHSAGFSSDGQLVATGSFDATARIWNASTGAPVGEPLKHPGVVTSASFSPDGRTVLTSCADGTARVWSVGVKGKPREFKGHTGVINHAAFSPDGSLVVTASADKTARVWELATGKFWTLRGHPQEVIWADFSRDGQSTVLTIGEKAARIWTNETEVQVRGHADWVNGADFSPGGEYIVTASQDGTARIWETSTGHSVADLLGHTDTVFRARFSPDGESVATASADHTARLWSVPKVVGLRGHRYWVTNAAFDRDGRRVVTTGWDGAAKVWDAETGSIIAELKGTAESKLNKAAFSPSGQFVVTAGEDGVARVWEIGTATIRLLLSGHTRELFSAAYSPDGARIVTAGGQDGMVKVWDATTGKEESTLPPHEHLATGARFSPDSRHILITGDTTARVLNGMTQVGGFFYGHTGIVYGGAFSPDGMSIVTASGDMTARVWEAGTGRLISVLRGHTARLTDAQFSPNGRFIVTASADKSARVWDATSGRILEVIENHADLVSSASFSPDGKRLLTSSDDGTAKIVVCSLCELSIRELTDLAGTRVTRELTEEEHRKFGRVFRIFGR